MSSAIWTGFSGKKYSYQVFEMGTNFKDIPGNYIYAKKTNTGTWKALYIGQTSSLGNRLGDHEKEGCAKRNGATHIHAHSSPSSEQTRKIEEVDLIKNYSPACNEQHVKSMAFS